MEGTAAPLPRTITYPQKIKTAKDKKTYKHNLLKKNPETLMADYLQKGDKSTITNLLLHTENCNAWHTGICKYYKNFKKLGICNGRQIQIHEEGGDTSKAFLTVNIYHNGTIMFQGNEACLSSVQANFTSLKTLAESEKQTESTGSHVELQRSGAELEEEEEPTLDCDSQLEQSVTQMRSSLSLQEVELVELRELLLSQTTSSERIQHLENKLHQLTRDFKTSVEELRGEIKDLQQDRDTLNSELKSVREELIFREREIQSLREQRETVIQPGSNATQTSAQPVLTPPEIHTPTERMDAYTQDRESTPNPIHAEIVILMDSNGKFINQKQLFPNHKSSKLWCPNTESALQQLSKETLGDPSHIIIHVGTNDLRTQQERVAQTDFHPCTIQRVNTDISRGCAGMPNVHLAHHPTLDIHNLHDHVHLRRDSVNVFAKNLKDVALGRTPGSPLKSQRESNNPRLTRRFIPAPTHSVFPPHPPEPWRLHRPGPLYPQPEPPRPRFRPPHPHPIHEHHRQHQQRQDPRPPYQRRKQPGPREAPALDNNTSTAQRSSAPQPEVHRPEQEQLSYAAALRGPNDTHSTSLREIKDMLNLICTRLMD
ncbi:unnamed protein product [Leuciscus chuanchicus]